MLIACSSDKDDSVYLEYTDFLSEVVQSVGEDAKYCGEVEITDSPLVVNNCIISEFENNNAFYAIHHLLGTESQATLVVSMSPNGNVILWNYYGGKDTEQQVTSEECENPSPNADLTIQYRSPFTCSNIQ
jgi:hypothetical protein